MIPMRRDRPAEDRWRPSLPMLGAAVAALGAGGVLGWHVFADDAAASGHGPALAAAATPAPAALPAMTAALQPVATGPVPVVAPMPPATMPTWAPAVRASPPAAPAPDPTQDLAAYLAPGERPTMAEIIRRLREAGVTGGIAAFPPPGTRPPRIGLAVPEGFELPPGYVRHHQSTDDGQPIEPMLMFAPGARFVDAAGQPVAIPDDRIVPPELAPPGLPLRTIAVPAPRDAGTPAR